MRTKTLLITLGALAVGALSPMAAPVTSINDVGYATVPTPQSGEYYLLATPFQIGVSNGANEVFGTSLPDFTLVLTWSVANQSYITSQYDSTQPTPGISWYAIDDTTPVTIPTLPPGQGFFLLPGGSSVTNTFVGSVAVNNGATNITTLPNSGVYYLLGSVIPFDGAVTNSGGIQLTNLPDFSLVLTWNVGSQSYTTSQFDSTQPTPGDTWYLIDDTTPAPVPVMSVGQGVFIQPGGAYNWQQTLNP
jgi:hypothetical protein